MKLKLWLFFLPTLFLVSGLSFGQTHQIRPGLWEQTMTMQSESGQMEKAMQEMRQQLAALPPEQRQMVEQMMAAQGVKFGEASNSFRICISPEQAKLDQLHLVDENCSQDILQRSGDVITIKFTCAGNPPSKGAGEVTILSPTEYKGRALINTVVESKPEQVTIEQVGRWIASDCGNLQPAGR